VDPVLCLLPSPLVGPSVWRPVAAHLTAPVAEVPHPDNALRTSEDVLAWFLAAIPDDEDIILVPHSNAGLYVPAITARRRVAGYVFVDAGLPPATGPVPLLPAEFYDFVAGKADEDGMVPPWTAWWEPDEIAGLFPSAEVRAQIEREQPRLPLSYFREELPVPAGWDDRPGAYLAFGDTYAEERANAKARGWPVRTLNGEHLHMLFSPRQVAGEITVLITQNRW
jgi:hypothetical protein